ncbi:MAG: tellurite resistance/C4-dicarboxylate transporter family protein [Nitrospiraceae bacterium]
MLQGPLCEAAMIQAVHLKDGVRNLSPAYFALVMATGIMAIAAHLNGLRSLALVLFGTAMLAYVVLWLLTLARLYWFRGFLLADLTSHARGAGFLTMVAGTCLLGNQFILLAGNVLTALVLWCLGGMLWLCLLYAWLSACIIGEAKPSLENGLNGTWLLMIVSTESLAILGTLLASYVASWQTTILFVSLGLFLLGGLLYIVIVVLVLYRLLFVPLSAESLSPLYWIDMGAEAIATLAGVTLIFHASDWDLLQELLPFLKGFTLLFWVMATWWIPLLCLLGAWRHLYKKTPLRYTSQYWSVVFPLGMYTVCTFQLSKVFDVPLLVLIPRVFFYLALGAWIAALTGLLYDLFGALRLKVGTKYLRSIIA